MARIKKKFSELMGNGWQGGADPYINGIQDDSRKVLPGDLFVARTGTKKSGADFAADAIAKGAVAVICEEPLQLPANIAFARVSNAGLSLANLAHEIACHPTRGMKMIAITGTKGKTTVAYLMRSVLKAAGKKVGMIGTVEIDDGQTTVPADMTTPGVVELVELFSRMRNNGVEYCVMEVSSHALHQHRVAAIDFAVAIFTNLTGDHLDYHKTMEDYAAAKAILFKGLKKDAFAIINTDDPWAERMTRECTARIVPICVVDRPQMGPRAIHPMEYPTIPGESATTPAGTPAMPETVPSGGFAGYIWQMSSRGMGMTVGFDGPAFGQEEVGKSFTTPLVGRHNCYNITSVFGAATTLGILGLHKDIQTRINLMRVWKTATGAPGRLQRVASDFPFDVFVDYAHTHDSLENVLKAIRATMRAPQGQLLCVFGCGGDRDRTKRPKMAAVAEKLADKVFVTSDNPRTEDPTAIIAEIRTGFSPNANGKITIDPDRRAAIRAAIAAAQNGDVVVIAGKGHENYQIIGTTKHHFDDVEEAAAALKERVV